MTGQQAYREEETWSSCPGLLVTVSKPACKAKRNLKAGLSVQAERQALSQLLLNASTLPPCPCLIPAWLHRQSVCFPFRLLKASLPTTEVSSLHRAGPSEQEEAQHMLRPCQQRQCYPIPLCCTESLSSSWADIRNGKHNLQTTLRKTQLANDALERPAKRAGGLSAGSTSPKSMWSSALCLHFHRRCWRQHS